MSYAQQGPIDTASDYAATLFLIIKMLKKLAGPTLVQVTACTNSGALALTGTVAVQPLVNQVDGEGNPTPHGVVHKMLYVRMQGGANAVIMDPAPGDVGLACFCSRDISTVKGAGPGPMNPQTPALDHLFDWADGVYLFGVLNALPAQYFQFNTQGITAVSPTQINLQAPTVAVSGNLTISGMTTGTGDGVFAGIDVQQHIHGGVQAGGSDTGPPV
jgi:hypothetical protein